MVKLGNYEVHPAADVFPLIGDEELAALADDIKHQGLQEPIKLTADGLVLVDGRNRYRACDLLNIEPLFEKLPAYYTEQNILDYIVSANVRRRHMNPGQLAVAALALEPMYAAQAKEQQGKRTDLLPTLVKGEPIHAGAEAAKAVGAKTSTVIQAKAVQRDAEDLIPKVKSGEMTLNEADKERKKRNAARPKASDPAPKPSRVMLTLRTHTGEAVEYPKPQSKLTFNETPGDGISWASWSWNPVTGCLHGCDYCYARDLATSKRYASTYPVGFTPLFHHERLEAPANTVIPAKHANNPAYKRVFVCSMADLYGRWVPEEWIDQVHESMLASPQWQYILLTKFPDRYTGLKMPDGAWVGTSVDEQKRVRIAERAFAELPDNVTKWLSLEPLREPLEFTDMSMFDWVVIGAQTRSVQPTGVVEAFAPPYDWFHRIYNQAREAGCKVHVKPNLIANPGMKWPEEYPGDN